jgi:hypothetical protein
MSLVFLVRLRRERRYIEYIHDTYRAVEKPRIKRQPETSIFPTLERAEQFAVRAVPLANPFLCAYGLIYQLPYSALYHYARCENLPDMPTLKANLESWELWWDETAPHMTDAQKAALWRLLDPQPWEIVEVELELESER